MKIATIVARILLGLMFVVFGLNFFLNFIPAPPPSPGLAADYFKVFAASRYMYVVGALQLLSGLLLLIGRFVPLALTILARSEERRVGKECRSRWVRVSYKRAR